MKSPRLPRLIRFLILNFVISLVGLTLLRIGFYLHFQAPDASIPVSVLSKAFFIGFRFDTRLILIALLPVLLLGWIKPINLFDTVRGRRIWVAYLTIVAAVIGLAYVLDFAHFAYLESRLNATILRFLYNLRESYQMVMESYPVWPLLIVMALFTASVVYGQYRLVRKFARHPSQKTRRWRRVIIVAGFVLVYCFGIYSKFSWYPLRWSDAFFSNNAFVSAIALNPALYFYDTWKNREITYDTEKVAAHYDRMADLLGVAPKDQNHLSFVRQVKGENRFAKPPNVIVVILESCGFYKTSLSGNPLDPTPNFDRIARQGILFRRFYTPHGGTARSVFAAITGIPDIELIKTSSRNPLVVRQHVIANDMKAYRKFYFLGGSASWGEIRGLLSTNINDLNLYEEGSYSSPVVDVWGVSDLDLFKEANGVLKNAGPEPFLAIIQTSGNHRPYTIPPNNDGFQPNPISDEMALRYGFRSADAYNSYRFMDHSIGRFIDIAKGEAYFDNTVFLFFGDHGLVRNAEHRPKYEHELIMNRYHVPLLIYAPGLITSPGVIDRVASEVDIMPTIAGMAGVRYTNSTFGRDLFDPQFNDNRYAFTILHAPVPHLGLISADFYYNVMGDGSSPKLFKLDPEAPIEDQYPEMAEKMRQLCLGIYESARYVRFHNTPEDIALQIQRQKASP